MFFNHTPTGLSPEIIHFNNNSEMYSKKADSRYLLRPETMESLYYLYYYTNDSIYKEWAWNIYQSVKINCKSNYGYAHYKDVYNLYSELEDQTETFISSEFMKYVYLIFNPKELFNHSTEILNTEAHILPIL